MHRPYAVRAAVSAAWCAVAGAFCYVMWGAPREFAKSKALFSRAKTLRTVALTKAFSPHGPYHHPGSAALHLTSASHSGHTSLATAVNSDRVGGAGGGVVRVEDVDEAGEEP